MGLPTPCAGWDVRELLRHLLAGYEFYMERMDGLPEERFAEVLDAYVLPSDFEVAFFQLGDKFEERFGDPAAFDLELVQWGGERIRGSYLLMLRVFDMTIHAWDLARAIGTDDTLDPKLVEMLWDQWSPRADEIPGFGILGDGPSGQVADNTPLQNRLLDLLGRRP